jgi:hypothetical protein
VISGLTGGRPPVGWPESVVQSRRKRRLRQRTTVSGVTITKAVLHPAHTLDRQTQKNRSRRRSFGRLAVRWLAFARRGHDYCSQISEADW